MMVQDQGDVIIKGSDYLTGGFVDFNGHKISLKDADEVYKVFLGELLFAFVDGGEGNALVKISSNSKEEILEEWLDKKKMENAAECDVIHEEHENVAGERLDADKSEMERDKEDYDPDYELFLNNLKPCGNAYVCELARKNHTVIAKYEDKDDDEFHSPDTVIAKYEDKDDDELRRKVPKSNPAGRNPPHTRRRNRSLRELKNLDIVHRNSSRYDSRDTTRSQRNTTRYDSRSHRPASRFADGPRWNGKRKAWDKEKNETPNHRRLSRRIPRELVEDERCDDLQEGKSQHDGCVASRNLPRRRGRPRKAERDKEKVQTPCQRKMYKEYAAFLGGIKMVGEFLVYIDKGGNQYRYDECSDEEGPLDLMNVEGSAKPPSSSGRNLTVEIKSSDKRVPSDGMNVKASAKPPPSSGRKGQEPSNKRLRSSDVWVPSAKPPSSSGRMTPEASNKRLKSSDKRVPSNQMNVEGSISEFRKRAMEILLKPYDRKDHIDLLKEAKLRRPVMHHREMRGRSTSFPDEVEVDKSYLDRYKELNKEIEAAQRDDPHKVLHLLRGLFFYLQCTCMEDSFVPWKDKSWLEAVHKSYSK